MSTYLNLSPNFLLCCRIISKLKFRKLFFIILAKSWPAWRDFSNFRTIKSKKERKTDPSAQRVKLSLFPMFQWVWATWLFHWATWRKFSIFDSNIEVRETGMQESYLDYILLLPGYQAKYQTITLMMTPHQKIEK